MKNIIIIGAGDMGKEIVWLIEDINKVKPTYLILGFLDDDPDKQGKLYYGYKVLGRIDQLEELGRRTPFNAVIAMQNGSIRKQIVKEHSSFSQWETIIHPSAVTATSSVIGAGTILFPQVTISADSKLGSFGLYYIHATICNDCIIGDYVSVMSGASILEHTVLGDECILEAGSCIYPHKRLGARVKAAIEVTVTEDQGDDAEVKELSTEMFRGEAEC